MKKRAIFCLITACVILSLSACVKKQEKTIVETKINVEEKNTETESLTNKRQELNEGEMYSYLTGEVIDESIGKQRPFAVMINNIEDAIPQSGIGQAEILYECPVESNITRLMALFQDIEHLDKLGSIRSARHYYMNLAQDDEAIFTHFGQSVFAMDLIEAGYPTISGLSGYSGSVFYRSNDREAPHNVYTTADGLLAGLDATGMTRDYSEGFTSRFAFYPTETTPEEGVQALKVTLPFSYNNPWFEFNTETQTYDRFQYGDKHIDAETGEQLSFKNIIVQYAKRSVISDQDHQDFALIGEEGYGDGYIITNGKAEKITWKRPTESESTKYYYEDGSEVYLNEGKTFIALVPSDTSITIE